MIFASVGSMLPFERFVRAVDEWARDNPDQSIFIQIGQGNYEPLHAPFTRVMPIGEYRRRLSECDLFVAHVGMGSILQALEDRKQMLMLPRLHSLDEHTTDHQLHTAARFGHLPGLRVANDVTDLKNEMSRLLAHPLLLGDAISNHASPELIAGVASFLASADPRLGKH